jgi:hypothetical protein
LPICPNMFLIACSANNFATICILFFKILYYLACIWKHVTSHLFWVCFYLHTFPILLVIKQYISMYCNYSTCLCSPSTVCFLVNAPVRCSIVHTESGVESVCGYPSASNRCHSCLGSWWGASIPLAWCQWGGTEMSDSQWGGGDGKRGLSLTSLMGHWHANNLCLDSSSHQTSVWCPQKHLVLWSVLKPAQCAMLQVKLHELPYINHFYCCTWGIL